MITLRNPRGTVLTIVLVFLVVLTLTAMATAGLTRSNTQVVNNIRNEKRAFFFAEAGVTESMLRLAMAKATPVTVGGRTFDARIAPKTLDPNWTAVILSGSFDPATTGSTFATPSVQAGVSALPYLTPTADPEALTIRWSLDGSGKVRRVLGKRVLQVESTGRSGAARRKVLVESTFSEALSTLILDPLACSGLDSRGTGKLNFPGGVHVNSTCSSGIAVNGSGAVTSDGEISVTGNYTGNVSPTPVTGAPYLPDPLLSLPVPSFVGRPVRSGAPLAPATLRVSDTRTLQPGIYYGGLQIKAGGRVRMEPGVYIMAGGGFSVEGNGEVMADEVMIYNTLAPLKPTGNGAYDSISVTANLPIRITSPKSGEYAGIVFFQDRLNTRPVAVGSGAVGTIDGVVYAANARLELSGGSKLLETQFVVGSILSNGNPVISMPSSPLQLNGEAVTQIAWSDW